MTDSISHLWMKLEAALTGAAAEDMAHDNHHMNKIDRLIDQLVDAGVSGQEIKTRCCSVDRRPDRPPDD